MTGGRGQVVSNSRSTAAISPNCPDRRSRYPPAPHRPESWCCEVVLTSFTSLPGRLLLTRERTRVARDNTYSAVAWPVDSITSNAPRRCERCR